MRTIAVLVYFVIGLFLIGRHLKDWYIKRGGRKKNEPPASIVGSVIVMLFLGAILWLPFYLTVFTCCILDRDNV